MWPAWRPLSRDLTPPRFRTGRAQSLGERHVDSGNPGRNGGKEKLLVNILDPNREVAPNYFAYTVDTKEEDSHTGILVNENVSSVTVRQSLGNDVVIPRSRIRKMQASKLSLMPEGLEEGLTNQDVADLLDFIFSDVQ